MLRPSLSDSLCATTVMSTHAYYGKMGARPFCHSSLGLVTWVFKEEKQGGCATIKIKYNSHSLDQSIKHAERGKGPGEWQGVS